MKQVLGICTCRRLTRSMWAAGSPKTQPGWTWREEGKMGLWSFQQEDSWRGTGIAFHVDKWVVMRKLHTPCGAWFRLRNLLWMLEIWVGSHMNP